MTGRTTQLVRDGTAAARRGALDEAERLLREAIEQDDARTDAIFELAGIEYAKRRYDEAIELMSRAIELDPTRPKVHYHRAMARYARGDLRGALADFDAELRGAPNDTESILSRAVTLSDLGEGRSALVEYERLMQLAPDDPRPYVNRGLLRSESSPDAAIDDFSEAIRRDEAKADAYMGRGFLLRAKGKRRDALADFVAFLHFDGPRLHGHRETVEAWIRELRAELWPAVSPSSDTPLSDLISLVLANPSSAPALAVFHDAFLDSIVGVIMSGGPEGGRGAHRVTAEDHMHVAYARAPAGGVMVLACADRVAFAKRFHQRFNVEMRGRDLLGMVLKLPDCEGVLLNSAASFHSILIPRDDAAQLLDGGIRAASATQRNGDDMGPTDMTVTSKNATPERPWWKFW